MEKENMQRAVAGHSLTLDGRTKARICGVQAVSCFNEQEIVLETTEGELALLGNGMHIEQLNLEDGQLEVNGSICGLEYSERALQRERRGLFGRKRK